MAPTENALRRSLRRAEDGQGLTEIFRDDLPAENASAKSAAPAAASVEAPPAGTA